MGITERQCNRCYQEARVAVQNLENPKFDYGEDYNQEIADRIKLPEYIVYPGGEATCARHLEVVKQAAEHILLTSGGSSRNVKIENI